jgi:hypothetical protein
LLAVSAVCTQFLWACGSRRQLVSVQNLAVPVQALAR